MTGRVSVIALSGQDVPYHLRAPDVECCWAVLVDGERVNVFTTQSVAMRNKAGWEREFEYQAAR